MNLILICLAVAASFTYIWDYTPFISDIQKILSDYMGYPVKFRKPLSCSLCMTTWVTLLILLIFNWKLAPLCLLFGWSTKHILNIFNTVDMLINLILSFLQKIILYINGNY